MSLPRVSFREKRDVVDWVYAHKDALPQLPFPAVMRWMKPVIPFARMAILRPTLAAAHFALRHEVRLTEIIQTVWLTLKPSSRAVLLRAPERMTMYAAGHELPFQRTSSLDLSNPLHRRNMWLCAMNYFGMDVIQRMMELPVLPPETKPLATAPLNTYWLEFLLYSLSHNRGHHPVLPRLVRQYASPLAAANNAEESAVWAALQARYNWDRNVLRSKGVIPDVWKRYWLEFRRMLKTDPTLAEQAKRIQLLLKDYPAESQALFMKTYDLDWPIIRSSKTELRSFMKIEDLKLSLLAKLDEMPALKGSRSPLIPAPHASSPDERHWSLGQDGHILSSRRNGDIATDRMHGWLAIPGAVRSGLHRAMPIPLTRAEKDAQEESRQMHGNKQMLTSFPTLPDEEYQQLIARILYSPDTQSTIAADFDITQQQVSELIEKLDLPYRKKTGGYSSQINKNDLLRLASLPWLTFSEMGRLLAQRAGRLEPFTARHISQLLRKIQGDEFVSRPMGAPRKRTPDQKLQLRSVLFRLEGPVQVDVRWLARAA